MAKFIKKWPMNDFNQTEFVSKVAVNLISELFKRSLNELTEFKTWINDKRKKHDPLGIAAKKYVDKLNERYAYVRIIGMQKPISLRKILVNVNVLDSITALNVLTIEQLEALFYEDGDIPDEGRINQLELKQNVEYIKKGQSFNFIRKTIPGIEMINNEDRVLLVGKPGAGKTTFQKSLILASLDNNLSDKLIPIYVNLKDWSDSKFDLLEFINNQFEICAFPNSKLFVENILDKGKCIVLLDGLDEALNSKKNVLRDIEDFIDKYLNNKYVITCRIAASNYIFEKFVEVEISDFDATQVQKFISNWFGEGSHQAQKCWIELNEENNARIYELASTPLLLTLICINYESSMSLPNNKAELYKEALDVLLKKWDSSRNIKREVIYKELSLRKKETLLSQIAFKSFSDSKYFFKKRLVELYIKDFISNLNNINSNSLKEDSESVLISIEAQHGLLIERAKNIYSFSHLTLQEYFTSRYLVDNMIKTEVNLLISDNILANRWREVFIIAAGILPEADDFLVKMQHEILKKYNNFELKQLFDKAFSLIKIDDNYFPLEMKRCLSLYSALDLFHPRSKARLIGVVLTKVRANILSLINSLALSYSTRDKFSPITKLSNNIRSRDMKSFAHDLNRAINFNSECIKNKGKDITFNKELIEVLNNYVQASRTLLDCINADSYITKETREAIHGKILLN